MKCLATNRFNTEDNMRQKIAYLLLLLLAPLSLVAQKEARAREILDRTCQNIEQARGVTLSFGGTIQGTMELKGEKFHLRSQGIESWYNGETQWSYLSNSDEVNITTPTPEDLQQTHPLYLLSSYQNGYNYKYLGQKQFKGETGHEVKLTPQKKEEIQSITLVVSTTYQPLYLKIVASNQPETEITITSFVIGQTFSDAHFQFDKKKYPNAEVIDLR